MYAWNKNPCVLPTNKTMIEIKMGINESIQILKRISTSLLQIRENANLTYKESHEDFVHKADAL